MKTHTFLIPFVAVLILLMVGIVSAAPLATITSVEFNGVEISSGNVDIAGFAGEVVPVKVTFDANVDSEDVKVRAEIFGGREDDIKTTGRINVVEGNTYTELLSLELPSDLKEETKDLTLKVQIFDANNDNADVYETYVVKMQRESYEFDILSVDYNTQVSAGDIFPVATVVRNTGFQRMDDGYVIVSIPELGVSSRGYFGDLIPTEEWTNRNPDWNDDEEDSMQKTVYLKVPKDAKAGVYEMDIQVTNRESTTTITRLVSVSSSGVATVLAAQRSQDMKAGETAKYELIIVNPKDNIAVFNLQAAPVTGLTVSVPSVVTVGPESSKTVEVQVTSDSNLAVGSYAFTVSAEGSEITYTANVTEGTTSSSVVALTVVLVIIFVVLLVILIVLLTRKDQPAEEVETSYY